MSTSHFENHRRAAEMHDLAAHLHRVAEEHGHPPHQDGQEHSRQALEHSTAAHQQTQKAAIAHGITTFSHTDIATRAHEIWQSNGCQDGTSQQDWARAAQELRSKAHTPKDSR